MKQKAFTICRTPLSVICTHREAASPKWYKKEIFYFSGRKACVMKIKHNFSGYVFYK